MPDLLLELRSEEIPARMQRKAAGDLKKLLTDGLVEAGLTYEAAREYWTPRRLALDLRGLTGRSRDIREERKGPSVSAPQQAIDGFVRAASLSSIAEAQVQSDPKKGDFYVAVISKPGRAAADIIAELVPKIIREFPWPKSMRSGAASAKPGSLRWVRPLQSIVCMLSTEPEEPVVVDFDIDGIRAGNVTYGHRFHAPQAFTVKRFEDYVEKLEKAKVVLDPERRREIILADAKNLCFAQGLELIEDEALLEEVSGLVEWPVVLMGEFEEDYLTIPAEVIRLTIKVNQKCFVTRSADGSLSNKFILTANIEASDGGAEIARGNGKVVRARLSDALYFWKTDQGNVPDLKDLAASAAKFDLDLTKPLDQRMARLDHLNVTFHAKLGTQGERVARIAKLAQELAPLISPLEGEMSSKMTERGAPIESKSFAGAPLSALPGISPSRGEIEKLAYRAATLAKADLQTEVVGEFPELQGLIGRKYAVLQGEHASVAAAIEDHWKPQGPADRVPSDPVAIAVALADKLDTLVGFWAIDEKPTGSKDPFALRRAALGVIRIVLERGVRISLRPIVGALLLAWEKSPPGMSFVGRIDFWLGVISKTDALGSRYQTWLREHTHAIAGHNSPENITLVRDKLADLLAFFYDRLKNYLRDLGARHDLIDAVLAGGAISPLEGEMGGSPERGAPLASTSSTAAPLSALPGISPSRGEIKPSANDDLLAIARRVEALTAFINTEDGKNLVAGYKRAANILAAEEKKGAVIENVIDTTAFTGEYESKLFAAVNQSSNLAGQALEKEDYSGAMLALSHLRGPVDAFLDNVMVNDPDEKVRANRLSLLSEIRRATARVADFSKISG